VGDYSRAKKLLGWSPKTTFKELVGIMLEHDLKLVAEER
jgi:GDPmannose 4,6-dehydratase